MTNENFSTEDGVLFNKDQTKLICFPPDKGGDVYTVPETVTTIGSFAFSRLMSIETIELLQSIEIIESRAFLDCYYGGKLEAVYYKGTQDQWDMIEIGEKNEDLLRVLVIRPMNDPAAFENEEFQFGSMLAGDNGSIKYTFDYDDHWFFSDNEDDHYRLMQLSIRTAIAAYGVSPYGADNIKALMDTMGFFYTDESVQYPKPEYDTIGYAIGLRNVCFEDGSEKSIILVAVRGGGYFQEWGGDFRMGRSGDHAGFTIAKNTVLRGLRSFINENKDIILDDFKILVTGYSRAAATSNLIAAALDDGTISGVSPENVTAFCFECPESTISANAQNSKYGNIINIVNPVDFVPLVPMSGWGFNRYGTTYYIPCNETDSDYWYYYSDMVDHYSWIASYNNIPADTIWGHCIFAGNQASALDIFFSGLATFIPRKMYYDFGVETSLMEIAATALGGKKNPDFEKFFEGFLAIPQIAAYAYTHGIITAEVGTMFALDYIPSGHYAELCMSWIDSLSGFSDYSTDGKYLIFKVKCPVDVTVNNSSGQIVGQIINDVPKSIDKGIAMWVDENGEKTFVIPCDSVYTINYTATDEGKVTCSMQQNNIATGITSRVTNYYDIEINNGDKLIATTDEVNAYQGKYTLFRDEEGELTEIIPDLDQIGDAVTRYDINVSVTGDGETVGGGSYIAGSYVQLKAIAKEGASFKGWYYGQDLISSDEILYFRLKDNAELTAAFTEKTKPESGENTQTKPGKATTVSISEKRTISEKPSIQKPAATKSKITVKWKHFKHTSKKAKKIWKKIKKVQVQCAADKAFKNIVKDTKIGRGKTKYAIKGLKKKTTYYVRVRYYDGTGYSAWSKVKKVKTK